MPKARNFNSSSKPLATVRDKEINDVVNRELASLKREVIKLELPSFNSDLGSRHSDDSILYNNDTIVASTIADRIIRKFEFPNAGEERKLKQLALRNWIDFESEHLAETSKGIKRGDFDRSSTYRAAQLVKSWLVDFDYFLHRAPIDFGPGESFISRQGDTSVLAKLEPEYFTVSHDALDDVIHLILNNHGLYNVFFDHFKTSDRVARSKDRTYKPPVLTPDSDDLKTDRQRAYRYARILKHFKDRDLVTYGSRASSVPKDNKKRRFINVEPIGNVILQKMYGWSLRQCLLKNAGLDLDHTQQLHKRMISNPRFSTVDWSNASDSILTELIRILTPYKIFTRMDRARSEFILIHDTDVGRKVYFEPLKFSSMGNGFTFELLTIVNLAFARVFDDESSAYGDDVVIRNQYAEGFISAMESVGFQVNWNKSFIDSPLRESCGAYFLDGYGYIRSYDIKHCRDIMDSIRVMGKLNRIIDQNSNFDHPIMKLIQSTRDNLMPIFPNTVYGPVTPGEDIPPWVEHCDYQRKHRSSKECRAIYNKHLVRLKEISSDYQRDISEFATLSIPVPRPKYRERVMDVVKYTPLLYAYIWAGRRTDMQVRVTERKLMYTDIIVDFEGYRIQRSQTSER